MSGKNAREPLEQRAELAADLVRDSYALFRQPAPAVEEPPLPTASVTEGEPPAEVPAETPAEVPAETPAEMPAEAPAEVPAESPAEVPAETPAEVPAETPAEVPTEAPAEVPTEPPAEVPAESPAEVPAEAPAEVPAESPVEVPAETPAEVPAEAPAEVPAEAPAEVPVPERVGEISADASKPAKAKKYEHGRTLWEEYLHKNVRQLLVGLVIALAVGALVAVLSKLSVPLFLLLAAVTYLLSCFFEYRRYRKLFLKHLRSTYQNPKPAQKPDVTSPEFVWDIKQETLSTADYAVSAPAGAAANEQPPEE